MTERLHSPTALHQRRRLLHGVGFLSTAILLLFIPGCSDLGDPVSNTPPDTTGNTGQYDWVDNIGPLLQNRCIACHGATVRENGFDARTYDAVLSYTTTSGNQLVVPGNPDGSELVQRVEGDGFQQMPVGGALSTDQITMIRDWIEDGAPENVENNGGGGGGGATVHADSITWDNTVGRILQNSCISCHSASVHENDFRVDTFDFVFNHLTEDSRRAVDTSNVEQSELLLRLEGNGVALMPYGGNKLASELIDSVRTWIENGAPQSDEDIGIGGGGGGGGSGQVAIDWVSSVGRILQNNCAACHSGQFPQSGLDLTDYDELFDHRTAANNDVIKEHDLEDSELYRRITADGFPQMPPAPNSPLSASEIDTIRQWILDDAPFIAGENRFAGQPDLKRLVYTSSSN